MNQQYSFKSLVQRHAKRYDIIYPLMDHFKVTEILLVMFIVVVSVTVVLPQLTTLFTYARQLDSQLAARERFNLMVEHHAHTGKWPHDNVQHSSDANAPFQNDKLVFDYHKPGFLNVTQYVAANELHSRFRASYGTQSHMFNLNCANKDITPWLGHCIDEQFAKDHK